MNPGYAGRSDLPDNLKALFRTVAMMVPNYALIAEIMLMSCGYKDARNLSRKIVSTFKLSSEQLSSQCHYDFGMRAIKSVLSAGARLKGVDPDQAEDVLILRSLQDCNQPKFLSHDLPLFNAITTDLFPGTKVPTTGGADLITRLKHHATDLGLMPVQEVLTKCQQLYDTIMVRHGLMLVGAPFAGKTNCYKILARAMSDVEDTGTVQTHCINPKSILMGQLYGMFDPTSHEWSDGVLAITVRRCAMDPSTNRKWVVFDGPVDAIWIENMNTVLDDNKKLCLNSGEIIKLSPTMTMMFEVEDLEVASPATVSRCGMVYMEPHSIGWHPIFDAYMKNKLPSLLADQQDYINALCEWLVPPTLDYTRRHVKEQVETQDIMLVQGLTRMFDAHLDAYQPPPKEDDAKDAPARLKAPDGKQRLSQLENIFIFAIIWSVGATGDTASRLGFDSMIRTLLNGGTPPGEEPAEPAEGEEAKEPARKAQLQIPEADLSVYDYFYDIKSNKWLTWQSAIVPTKIADGTHFHEITVRYPR